METHPELDLGNRPYPYFMGGSVKVYPLHQLLSPQDPPRIGEWSPVISEETRRAVAKYSTGPAGRQIYLHIPFCPAFCHFCILYKTQDPRQQGDDYRERFVAALLKEIEAYSRVPATRRQRAGAIYFGGGTPSMLTAEQVERIMNALAKHIPIDPDAEITFEGMPNHMRDVDYLRALRATGVNRISFGIQTMQPELRKHLGRIDTVEDVYACADAVEKAGMPELNVELLFGVPGMTPELMRDDIEQCIRLQSGTIDLIYYNATPGTQYYDLIRKGARPPQTAGEDLLRLRLQSVAQLEAAGFRHTSGEVFDRRERLERFQEIHFGGSDGMDEIIGLGPSSYGFLDGVVYQNVPSVTKYIECIQDGKLPLRAHQQATPDQVQRRGIVYGLQLFRVRSAIVNNYVHKALFLRWEHQGLVERVPGGYKLTRAGRNWYNMMQLDIIPMKEGRAALDLLIDRGELERLLFRPEQTVGNVGLVREIERFIEGPVPALRAVRRYFFLQQTRMHRSRGKVGPSLNVIQEVERGQNAFTGE
jgi:coproporphyrinogen III oxidase-like Fe-S oxidoreductase